MQIAYPRNIGATFDVMLFIFYTAKANVNILTLYDVNSEQHLININ